MTGDPQDEVIAFLGDPATHGGAPVSHVETHGAHVFLVGETALKIKRPVHYSYMNFSTIEAREAMLRRELDLNQPTAPKIYRDVVPVTREGQALALDGPGAPVEWVLRMWRFPERDELTNVANRGDLTADLAEQLGTAVARYQETAPLREGDGAQRITAIVEELEEAFSSMCDTLGAAKVARFSENAREALDAVAPILSKRARTGHLRRCHGDLHLGNFVLIDGDPVPFDALEFDEELATCDVLYDVAFLVMDLFHRGFALQANIVLNAWLYARRGEEDTGLVALPLFLALRAGIRAMVMVQTDSATHHEGQSSAEARRYLQESLKALEGPVPRLLAVGGLSGTGKTVVSRALAPQFGRIPGAVHLRSDLERKALAGVHPLAALPDSAYTPEVTRAVYKQLISRAETLLSAGRSVVLDATFLDPQERRAARTLAERAGVSFTGLWLDAPGEVLAARVTERHGDASDADASVVRRQLCRDVGENDWTRVDASDALSDVVTRARAHLGESPEGTTPAAGSPVKFEKGETRDG